MVLMIFMLSFWVVLLLAFRFSFKTHDIDKQRAWSAKIEIVKFLESERMLDNYNVCIGIFLEDL